MALGVAASPLLAVAPTWISERPESRTILIAPLLLAWEAWRQRGETAPARRPLGLTCLALSLLSMLAGFETDSPSLGLGGLALGIFGVAAWTGRPPAAVALLAVWLVPVPIFLLERLTPALETLWMRALVGVAEGLGAELVALGPVAFGPGDARVEFFPADDGLVLAHGMALIGHWLGLRRSCSPPGLLAWIGGFALLGFALQGAVMLTALLRVGAGDEAGAASALVQGPLVVVALAVTIGAVAETWRTRAKATRPPG